MCCAPVRTGNPDAVHHKDGEHSKRDPTYVAPSRTLQRNACRCATVSYLYIFRYTDTDTDTDILLPTRSSSELF